MPNTPDKLRAQRLDDRNPSELKGVDQWRRMDEAETRNAKTGGVTFFLYFRCLILPPERAGQIGFFSESSPHEKET
jgi:hypothetical protein